jgi:hypothetical protein
MANQKFPKNGNFGKISEKSLKIGQKWISWKFWPFCEKLVFRYQFDHLAKIWILAKNPHFGVLGSKIVDFRVSTKWGSGIDEKRRFGDFEDFDENWSNSGNLT